jgi:hypothetical protein
MAGQYLARVMKRQSDYFEAFLRDELSHLVNRVSSGWWIKWRNLSRNVSPRP